MGMGVNEKVIYYDEQWFTSTNLRLFRHHGNLMVLKE